MSIHPYWAYEAVPGTLGADLEKAALDEGRRAFALECATQWNDTAEGTIATAKAYEAYLKGETRPRPLTSQELLGVEARGASLHVGGAPVWYCPRPVDTGDDTPWARYGPAGQIVERYPADKVEVEWP